MDGLLDAASAYKAVREDYCFDGDIGISTSCYNAFIYGTGVSVPKYYKPSDALASFKIPYSIRNAAKQYLDESKCYLDVRMVNYHWVNSDVERAWARAFFAGRKYGAKSF